MGEDHTGAGQGPVLLDIGGTVGALVVHLPVEWVGREIEIRPAGSTDRAAHCPHVAVIARATARAVVPTAVFPALEQGDYELIEKQAAGDPGMRVSVVGGAVTEVSWPGRA